MRDWVSRLPVNVGASLALGAVATAAVAAGPGQADAAWAASRAPLSRAAAGLGSASFSGQKAFLPAAGLTSHDAVTVAARSAFRRQPPVAPLHRLLPADLLVVSPTSLPSAVVTRIKRLPGVAAADPVDAARIRVDGKFVALLGVDPSVFRGFAAPPTARASGLWRNVAGGSIAVSYTMGKLDKLPLGRTVRVDGTRTERLPVAGFGTVGIAGVDAVVSSAVARSLGVPAGNAIVISAPRARLASLTALVRKLLPRRAAVAALVAQQASAGTPVSTGAAGTGPGTAGSGAAGSGNGPAGPGAAGSGPAGSGSGGASGVASPGAGLSAAQIASFLAAAQSRIGLPYVWGAAGPRAFDCSGLVQWSLAQAGVVMPRVAADQARTGPQVPVRNLQPGDLLFYHTDPTAPTYISHVAIYLGNGLMIQAPQPGMNVQVVRADVGNEFAGAVRVELNVAAQVAASPAG